MQKETQTSTLVKVCWSVTPREEEEKYQNKRRPALWERSHELNPSFTQITNSNSRKTEMSSVKKKSTIQMSVRKYLLDPEWEKTKLYNIMIILT